MGEPEDVANPRAVSGLRRELVHHGHRRRHRRRDEGLVTRAPLRFLGCRVRIPRRQWRSQRCRARLYGLYRVRDGLSAFTITIVYAIWAAGHDRRADRRPVHIDRARRPPWRDARSGGDDDGGRRRARGSGRRCRGCCSDACSPCVAVGMASRHGDRVPHRAPPPRGSDRVAGPRPDDRHTRSTSARSASVLLLQGFLAQWAGRPLVLS